MSDHPLLLTQVKHAYEIHDVEWRAGRELHPGWAPDREFVKLCLLGRRKKIDRGEHAGALRVPDRLFGLGRALVRVVAASVELGLPVLTADPHDLPPPFRLSNEPDHVGVPADSATAALEGAAT